MSEPDPDPLRFLSGAERDCVRRYCGVLRETLGDDLRRVVLFGSAARGDMWPPGSPLHSDIDLLVVTARELPQHLAAQLVNETYPLYLECGRQIGPQFRTGRTLGQPGERARTFAGNIARDGVDLIV